MATTNASTAKTPNYTPEQETLIRDWPRNSEGKLSKSIAEAIASDPRMNTPDNKPRTQKMITAKIVRMGLPYAKAAPARKDGTAVQVKADLVAEIARLAGVTFEGLAIAPRGDLVKLRDVLAA